MFYLTNDSTHFIYGYMVNDHSDSERGNPLPPYGLLFRLTVRILLYAPSHRQDNTYHGLCYTSRGALAGTRNSSVESVVGYQWLAVSGWLSEVGYQWLDVSGWLSVVGSQWLAVRGGCRGLAVRGWLSMFDVTGYLSVVGCQRLAVTCWL